MISGQKSDDHVVDSIDYELKKRVVIILKLERRNLHRLMSKNSLKLVFQLSFDLMLCKYIIFLAAIFYEIIPQFHLIYR